MTTQLYPVRYFAASALAPGRSANSRNDVPTPPPVFGAISPSIFRRPSYISWHLKTGEEFWNILPNVPKTLLKSLSNKEVIQASEAVDVGSIPAGSTKS